MSLAAVSNVSSIEHVGAVSPLSTSRDLVCFIVFLQKSPQMPEYHRLLIPNAPLKRELKNLTISVDFMKPY